MKEVLGIMTGCCVAKDLTDMLFGDNSTTMIRAKWSYNFASLDSLFLIKEE